MDLLLFSGQSNMQGQTECCPDAAPVAHALEYRFYTDELIPLAHPVGEDIGELLLAAHEGHGSLVPAFCRAYSENTGRAVTAVRKAQDARRAAERAGHPIEKVYFIWLQGESDAIEGTSRAEYEHRLCALRAHLVRDLEIDAFTINRVGKFVQDERDLAIICAQEALCRSDDFALLTRMTGALTQDEAYLNPHAAGHFNNAGMERLGGGCWCESGAIATRSAGDAGGRGL